MKALKLSLTLVLIIGGIFLTGCNKDAIVGPQNNDVSFLKEQVVTSEEVSDFLASEDVTLDDVNEREFNYDDFGSMKITEPITPLRWGRKVEKIDREITVVQLNDSIAVATIVKTITGKFIVIGVKDSAGVLDTVRVLKPFVLTTTRKVRFLKIDNNRDPRKNWKPIAITLVEGKTSLNDFGIAQLEVITAIDTATITDPLSYWMRFAPGRGGVVILRPGDSVMVRLTVTSQNEKPEYALLRHSVDHKFVKRNRMQMELVSTTGSSGNYTRVYEKKFIARLPMGFALGRYNAIVDVMSYDSINDDDAPYMNAFWGMPYLVKRF
jgi:hypothetical protein